MHERKFSGMREPGKLSRLNLIRSRRETLRILSLWIVHAHSSEVERKKGASIEPLGHSNHVVELQRSSPAKKIPSGWCCRCSSSALYSLHTAWFTDVRYTRNVIADLSDLLWPVQQSFVCITLCGAWLYAYNLDAGGRYQDAPATSGNVLPLVVAQRLLRISSMEETRQITYVANYTTFVLTLAFSGKACNVTLFAKI